ncbi:MAG: DUF4352 domain-containing protein [Microlunatus sp.]|nr:DUF4352 domain-containing protein [Microlunatus sp.]
MSNATMPPQYQPVQQVEPAKKNGLGITALVIGLVGVPLAIIPLVGPFLGIPLGILALGFAVFGLVLAFRGRAGKGLPIAGAILGIASMAIGIGQAAVISGAVDDSGNATDSAVVAPQNPGADGNAGSDQNGGAEQQPAATAGIGDTVTDGDLSFTVTNVETGVATVGDEYWSETASGQYVIVDITVKNVGSEAATFDATGQYLYNAAGDRFSSDSDAMVAVPDSSLFDEINPGNSVEGKIIFDMPEGATPTSIQLHGSMFSEGVTVNLT